LSNIRRTIEQTWHPQPVARGKHVTRDTDVSALRAETFEMRKYLLTLALLDPRKNAETILKIIGCLVMET